MFAFLTPAACLVALLMGTGSALQPDSVSLHIDGSSNVHDWTSEATEVRVDGQFQTDASGRLTAVEGLKVVIPVERIKSEKGRIMDNKTYKALDADEHPEIRFVANAVRINGATVSAEGQLTIAGQSRPVTLTGQWKQDASGSFLTGSYAMKMSDFGIDPPTAMMGAMKTADDVTIRYHVQVKSLP